MRAETANTKGRSPMTQAEDKKICLICETEFSHKHPGVLTCSPECSDKLREQRRRERYWRDKSQQEHRA